MIRYDNMIRYDLIRLFGGILGVLTIFGASVLLAATIFLWSYLEEDIQWTRIVLLISIVTMALSATFCLYFSYDPTGDLLEQTSHLEPTSNATDTPQSSMEIPSLNILQMEMQTTASKLSTPSSTQNSDTFKKIDEDFGQKVDKKFNEIETDMKEGIDTDGEELPTFGQKVDTKINEIGADIKEGMDKAGEELAEFGQKVDTKIKEILGTDKKEGNVVEEKIFEAVTEAKEGFDRACEEFRQIVEKQIDMTVEDNNEGFAVAEANIKEGLVHAGEEFEKVGQNMKERIDLACEELIKLGENIENKNMSKEEEKPKKSKLDMLKKFCKCLQFFNCPTGYPTGHSCKCCGSTWKRLCNCCSVNCCAIYF